MHNSAAPSSRPAQVGGFLRLGTAAQRLSGGCGLVRSAHDVLEEALPQVPDHAGLLLRGAVQVVGELELDAVNAHALDLGQGGGHDGVGVGGDDEDLGAGQGRVRLLDGPVQRRVGVVGQEGHADPGVGVRAGTLEVGQDGKVDGRGVEARGLGRRRAEALHQGHFAGMGRHGAVGEGVGGGGRQVTSGLGKGKRELSAFFLFLSICLSVLFGDIYISDDF